VISRVAVFAPVDRLFDYAVPPALSGQVRAGARVWAPFGGRSLEGVVTALDPPDALVDARPLERLIDAPAIAADLVQLAVWMSQYYCAPPGEVMRLMVPAGGQARQRRKLSVTAEGRALAAQLGGALEPPALADLDEAARALLAELHAGGRRDAADKRLRRVLATLVERGLVAVGEQVSTRGARLELRLRVGRALEGDELERAPRRAAIHARIAAAGEITLSELRREDVRAGEHVRVLAAAGLVLVEEREVASDPFAALPLDPQPPPELTAAQKAALATVEPALRVQRYAPYVLHGVTGSGKTEVYLRAIAAALELGRTALVLVPEISLTPQLAARFRGRFGDRVAVLHSGLGDAARADAWRRIQRGQVSIALGARSAVFAPLANLGVVVVDEEHDSSFKQEEGVRYHGRDVALMRARFAGAVALLGSATPSLETYFAAQQGRLGLISLPERATARPLPPVEIIDLKLYRPAEGGFLTAPLERAIVDTLQAGEQAILFLNRRGFSTFVLCKACGEAMRCRDCSVSLTYHRASDRLLCHYCGFACPPPESCPQCRARSVERLGYGTEQVEAALVERFPGARVARLDRDTAHGDGLNRVLERFRARAIDLLVGTQMVTKGHDFPGVTLVGVVLADQAMGLPDFRASERTYQLLEQVAGRAGRGERAGRVLVQTYNPEHVAVTCARDHAYARFAELELAARREPEFPPHTRLACVRVDGADAQAVRATAEAAARAASAAARGLPEALRAAVLGPSEAPLSRLKGRTRWQLFVSATQARPLRQLARAAADVAGSRGVRLSIDIDPISML
jgi:primosomal protein N' (replication factor Y)